MSWVTTKLAPETNVCHCSNQIYALGNPPLPEETDQCPGLLLLI